MTSAAISGWLGLVLPFVLIVGAAIVIPKLLARILPEGIAALSINAVLSAIILTAVSAGYFIIAYTIKDTRILDLFGYAPKETIGYFSRLGLAAALIWGPVLVLTLASLPKSWTEVEW